MAFRRPGTSASKCAREDTNLYGSSAVTLVFASGIKFSAFGDITKMIALSKPRNVNGNFGTSDLRILTYAAKQENKKRRAGKRRTQEATRGRTGKCRFRFYLGAWGLIIQTPWLEALGIVSHREKYSVAVQFDIQNLFIAEHRRPSMKHVELCQRKFAIGITYITHNTYLNPMVDFQRGIQ
jgi:hypothetical protein